MPRAVHIGVPGAGVAAQQAITPPGGLDLVVSGCSRGYKADMKAHSRLEKRITIGGNPRSKRRGMYGTPGRSPWKIQ